MSEFPDPMEVALSIPFEHEGIDDERVQTVAKTVRTIMADTLRLAAQQLSELKNDRGESDKLSLTVAAIESGLSISISMLQVQANQIQAKKIP